MTGDDGDLRERFGELRQEDERRAPSFAHVRDRGRSRARARRVPRAVLGLVGAAAVAGALAAAVLLRPQAPLSKAPAPPPSITEWRSPTDFLLRTPGLEILRTVPSLGRDLPPFAPSASTERRRPS